VASFTNLAISGRWESGTLTFSATDLTGVRPVALKLSVRSPPVPLMERFVKLAVPPEVVVAVSVPPSVPPPVAIAAVTVTPVSLTALPAPHIRSCTTGCWANATPLWPSSKAAL